MSEVKQKEEKYLVLKQDDIKKYLELHQLSALIDICETIDSCRKKEGKQLNHYVVVNESEPYAETVWDLVLDRKRKDEE